jgi:Trp operon repressor
MPLNKNHAELISVAEAARRVLGELDVALAKVARGPRSNAKVLSPDEVARIRRWHAAGGVSQREIADAYDINPATVSRIVRRQYHRS